VRNGIALLFCVVVTALAGCSGGGGHDAAVQGVVDADLQFVADLAELGMRSGFLEHLGERSIVFRPGPVDAREAYTVSEDAPGLLAWEPTMVDAAASGDLGLSTGPWDFRPGGEGTAVAGTGHYVSVWLKNADGEWKVAITVAVPHRPMEGETPELVRRGHARASDPYEPAAAFEDVLDAETALWTDAQSQGFMGALASALAPDGRVYRMGMQPIVGPDAVREAITAEDRMAWEPRGGSVGESGDLGYTYGIAMWTAPDDSGVRLPQAYLRIWERMPGGEWHVVIDIMKPMPPGPEQGQ